MEPRFSFRLIIPFLHLMAGEHSIPPPVQQVLATLNPDERIPVRAVLRWLDWALMSTGDPDVGLRAALRIETGGHEMLRQIMRSASNAGEALELGLRYIRLVNEAADFQLRIHKGLAVVELRSRIPLPRAASDFQSAALVVAARTWLGGPAVAIEPWFAHAAPERLDVYRQVYGDVPIRFSAPYDAVAFPARVLDERIQSSDPELHQLVRREAERLISKLPDPEPLTARVRKMLLGTLPAGTVSADYVAARLGISRRTLTRRLESEQTTYAELLEAARRELAHQHLADRSMDIQQIAFLLGYSETSAFSRAFKRWSGQSPQQYRDGLP